MIDAEKFIKLQHIKVSNNSDGDSLYFVRTNCENYTDMYLNGQYRKKNVIRHAQEIIAMYLKPKKQYPICDT